MNPDDLLTITDAERQYAVNRRQLERACKGKELPIVAPSKVGKRRRRKQPTAGAPVKYRFTRAALEAWLNSRTPPADYIPVDVAAEQCHVNQRELYDAIKLGEVPAHIKQRRFGREPKIYVRVADVEAWRDDNGVRRYRVQVDKPQ